MEINLTKDTIVDKRTGEVSAPGEYVENLRAIEANIQHADDEIVSAKAALKHAKDAREKLVAQLRTAVRDGQVLPLLEAAEDDDDDAPPDGAFETDDFSDTGE